VKDGPRSGDPQTAGYWFQTTGGVKLDTPGKTAGPWAQPAVETFGNVGRNSFRGPKFFNTDFSVFKTFSVTERFKTQFQFNAYNVFNHVNFDRPNSCVDCSSAGNITGLAFGSTMRRLQFGLKLNF
jgi:hypothetical protein